MSRYWVFTEEQLKEALIDWVAVDGHLQAGMTATSQIVAFLNSPTAFSMGMARDIDAPAVPEIHVAEESAS